MNFFTQRAPALIIDLGIGVVGFVASMSWCRVTGREMGRDTVMLLAKMWIGIALIGVVLACIM